MLNPQSFYSILFYSMQFVKFRDYNFDHVFISILQNKSISPPTWRPCPECSWTFPSTQLVFRIYQLSSISVLIHES